jgi:hypothetical protein
VERPNWNTGDTIKSIGGVIELGRQAVARAIEYIGELPERIDTHFANGINRGEDE